MQRRYDWRRALPDKKRPKVSLIAGQLPSLIDLRGKCPPVVDQGDLGSCTANALAGAVEFGRNVAQVSRLFIYYGERSIEGDPGQDSGANLSDGVKVLETLGVCSEALWPYKDSLIFKQPSHNCYLQAVNNKVKAAKPLSHNLEVLKTTLAGGLPFVFGFTVYSSFESQEVADTGMMPMPNVDSEDVLGGHAVLCCGYDDSKNYVIVRNSWGTDWGKEGYFFMPYEFISDPEFASDFWAIY